LPLNAEAEKVGVLQPVVEHPNRARREARRQLRLVPGPLPRRRLTRREELPPNRGDFSKRAAARTSDHACLRNSPRTPSAHGRLQWTAPRRHAFQVSSGAPPEIHPESARNDIPERTNGSSSSPIHFSNGSVNPCFGRATAAIGSGRTSVSCSSRLLRISAGYWPRSGQT